MHENVIGVMEMERLLLDEIKRLVIYAILMAAYGGILEKSPKYVSEKFREVMNARYPENALDPANLRKYRMWLRKWLPS